MTHFIPGGLLRDAAAGRRPVFVSRAIRAAGALLAAGAALVAASPAEAGNGFYVHGAGNGHGIGMSQYGTLGFALHNWSYTEILGHYYENTQIGATDPGRIVTVLLADGSATFSGATRANGKTIKPGTSYTVQPASNGKLNLVAGGKRAGSFTAPLTVSGNGTVDLAGYGLHRGSLVFRPDASGGVETVNALDLEDYVRGVISAEMPSSWPMAALEAQAVAARTYAITAGAAGADFEVFSDTRSQMYQGVQAETPRTDQAVAATRGQIVTYDGTPATTYFFSSSGGYTESIQNVWEGVTPEAWLHGVPDPYDNSGGNPYYRWKLELGLSKAQAKLRGLYRGSFEGIKILQHGVSPRIVTAAVVGSKGRSTVSGARLEQIFSLMSTYVSFTTIATQSTGPSAGQAGAASPSGQPSSQSGGAGVASAFRRASLSSISGTVFPGRSGMLVSVQERIQTRGRSRWTTIEQIRTGNGGAYAEIVPGAGRYRVAYDGMTGQVVTVA